MPTIDEIISSIEIDTNSNYDHLRAAIESAISEARAEDLARIAELEAELSSMKRTNEMWLKHMDKLGAERDALKVERDEWAEKWHQMRRQYGEMRWPGMTRVVTASDAAMNQPKEGQ